MDEIKAAGGITCAQDESAAYEGMPRSAMMAGTVDFRLAPAEIAGELGKIARHAYIGTDGPPERIVEGAQTAPILRLLHQSSGVDFTHYQTATLRRGVERARTGLYPKSIAERVSPERLRRFFYELDGKYRVAKAIRDLCVFAKHNVLEDPPFSRIDVISCRNMLIYLEPVMQQYLLPTLHYALRSTGVLLLGGSESTGVHNDLFDPIDPKHRFYGRKPTANRLPPPLVEGARLGRPRHTPPVAAVEARRGEGAQR